MRKEVVIIFIIFICISFSILQGEGLYRPYPILWVHGIWADPGTWGANHSVEEGTEENPQRIDITGFDLSRPTIYEIDTRYYRSLSVPYPYYSAPNNLTHIYHEVMAFVPNDGSVDEDPKYDDIGEGAKLVVIVKQVLEEYYGSNWESNPDAKIVLVCHSLGALAARQAIMIAPEIREHIWKLISIGTAHQGSVWATPLWRETQILGFVFIPMIYHIGGKYVLDSKALDYHLNFGGDAGKIWISVGINIGNLTNLLNILGVIELLALPDFVPSLPPGGYDISHGAVPDMNRWSSCLNTLNNYQHPENIKYVWIVNGNAFNGSFETGFWVTNYAWAAIDIIKFPLSPIGYLELAGTIISQDFENGSDLVVTTGSQNPNDVQAFRNAKGEVYRTQHHWHGDETNQWKYFRNAIAEQPLFELKNVIIDGELFSVSGEKDTVPGFIEGLQGTIVDFFLANNDFKVEVNYFYPKTLHWPTELGYDGNKFKVEDIGGQTYYGWNHIEITSENVLGEKAEPKTYELLVMGGPIANIISPSIIFSVSRESEKCALCG
jgi:pimeloyl-ACP methyl ester carboxylesterase